MVWRVVELDLTSAEVEKLRKYCVKHFGLFMCKDKKKED